MELPELPNPFTEARIVGKDVPNADYVTQDKGRGDPKYVMSRSDLMEFARCPHRWRCGYKDDEPTTSTDWGSLIDGLALQPHRFDDGFVVTPSTYEVPKMECPECGSVTDAKTCAKCKVDRVPVMVHKAWDWNAKYCQEWGKQNGRAFVKPEKYVEAGQAVQMLASDPQISELLRNSEKQVMVMGRYVDRETGLTVMVKGMIDIVPSLDGEFAKCLVDLKTARSAHPRAWQRAVYESGYHVQAALYLDLYTKATGEDRVSFLHIVQENYKPFETAKRILSAEFVELGRGVYLGALKRYCQCLKTNEWPGYTEETVIDGFGLCQPEAWMIQ